MKKMKSVLSFVLCLVMLVSLLPGTALEVFAAKETPTIVIAGSDYQNSGSAPKTNVENILAQIKEDYSAAHGFLFGGDYSQIINNSSSTTSGIKELKGVVQGVYDTGMEEVYVQGNHDASVNDLTATGDHDTDDYGVFSINEDDFSSGGNVSSNMLTDLENYLDRKVSEKYKKPVFVTTHLPLHATSRGDNTGASEIFKLLNKAGESGLNIIFLFGHNHSGSYDDYLGGGAIYLPKGSSITVAGGSTSKLNFTYMNYGYVGYVNGSADTTLTMTAFEITDNEVTVKRYDTNGLHNLKAAGTTVSGYSTDSNVYGTAVIDLDTGASTTYDLSGSDDSNSSGSNGTVGGSGYTYELVTSIEAGEKYVIVGNDDAVALMDNGGNMDSQSVTISGITLTSETALTEWTFSDISSGTITSDAGNQLGYSSSSWNLSGDGDCNFDIAVGSNNFSLHVQRSNTWNSRYYFYYDGSAWAKDSSNIQYVRLYKPTGTGSGGGSTATPEGGDWVTISSGEGGTIYTLDQDGLNVGSNEKYLIVHTSANGIGNVLTNSNGKATNTQLTITDKVIVVSDDSNIAWTPTGSDTSANFANGGYNIYLSYNDGVLYTSTRNLIVTHSGNGEYTLKRESNYSGYYVQYGSSDGWDTLSTTSNSVYLFRKTGTEPAGDAEYAKLVGGLTYTVSRGATAEKALAKVMEGIDVLTSANADGSNPTTLDDADITWTMASDYDGTVPGEYAVTISYKGIKLGTAQVIVLEVTITGCELMSDTGTVGKGSSKDAETGAYIKVSLEDGTSYNVPVTVGMLTDAAGNTPSTKEITTITGLTVRYNGQTFENFTLNVTAKAGNNYPEYPNQGAVKVSKTGTGIQFQSTGVAQVEISASGIPMNQGVDVVLVLDTSTSMAQYGPTFDFEDEDGNHVSGKRIDLLRPVVNDLIQQFKTKREDGSDPDIDIAIVTFNGNTIKQSTNYIGGLGSRSYTYGIKTGDGTVTGGWEHITNISSTWATDESNANTPTSSGTNYDYGLLMAYELLAQKKADSNSERKQFVLFLSDGAPSQYNGVESNDGVAEYEDWILANYKTTSEVPNTVLTNREFYTGYNNNNGQLHRTAEAIKALPGEAATIVTYDSEGVAALKEVDGLGATMYSIGMLLQANGQRSAEDQEKVLRTIASDDSRFRSVKNVIDLEGVFNTFAGEVLMAATNARFVDQMGDDYDLQMGQILDLDKNPIGVENKIEIISYDIYTRADGTVNADKIGDRKGTSTVLETITFHADGTEAYSDKDSVGPNGETIPAGSNILIDGVIYAKNFWYNANHTPVTLDGVDIPTGIDEHNLTIGSTNVLPAETFYWNIGTIKTTELAMRYYVYLTGSMEGTREAGSYPTNEYATLYYDNYLENPCYKETVSPVMAWKSANVSYAFYLVDENGNIIVNQTTGETGSFANKIAVTNPVVYKEILLNNTNQVNSIDVASTGVLPEGYELYDDQSVYTIEIQSDATGSWNITKGNKTKASTYVTQFDPDNAAAYSNELTKDSNADFTHTVVWFAVRWKVQALPDTVVIDYGLPVDISVLANDMFGDHGKLAGVGAYSDSLNLDGHDAAMASGFGNTYNGEYGSAKAEAATGKVRYTPADMEMNGYDKFAYAVNYTGATNPGYYYDTVTVIPATTIYFEDNFVDYKRFTWDDSSNGWAEKDDSLWSIEGTVNSGAVQGEDRPGQYSLIDANNIYGYDSANLNMTTYSMGSAHKATVDYDNYAQAQFTFWGTGFDVISMTSNMTGTILVDVEKMVDGDWNEFDNYSVDTYYGYKQDSEGNWVVDPDASGSLYQVPVIKMVDKPYGQYRVTIKATYESFFDHVAGSSSYDFYLDAIRIYDPANDGAVDGDAIIEDAYKADHEGWPSYIELRNALIDVKTLGNAETNTKVEGLVFIDGDASVGDAKLNDYLSYGPNNEVYLAPGQCVAFQLGTPGNIDKVHIGIKSADSRPGTYTIKNIAQTERENGKVKAGDYYNAKTNTIDTTTDMYYDLTGWKNDIIVISNTGDQHNTKGVISITNIKSTYTSAPAPEEQNAHEPAEVSIYMTPKAAELVLNAMKPEPVNPFADIQKEQFFYDSVLWAVKNGITNGVDAAHFGPYLYCNRAQVVTFLWRAAGSPAPETRNNPFTDVPADGWYTEAVLWAVENGITNGLTDTTFGPDALCNRAQVVTFLWRANGSRADNASNPFEDVPADAFYHDAVIWALNNGITTGAAANAFDPNGTCMRAHVVTFLYRAEQLPELSES